MREMPVNIKELKCRSSHWTTALALASNIVLYAKLFNSILFWPCTVVSEISVKMLVRSFVFLALVLACDGLCRTIQLHE